MKKLNYFAMMGAIALTGLVTFTACSSSEDAIDNPNYDSETNTVKTQFTISLPPTAGRTTRMLENAVKQTIFSGIGNIKLLPLSAAAAGTSSLTDMVSLADFSAFDHSESNTKVYSNIQFATGVNRFVFFGNSLQAGNDFEKGALTVSMSGSTLADVSFSLVTAYNATNASTGTSLLAALNGVAGATPLESNGTTAATIDADGDAGTDPTSTKFYEIATATNPELSTLKTIAEKYLSTKVGSSNMVRNLFRVLYNELAVNVTEAAFSSSPNVAKMAMGIRKKIESYFETPANVATSELVSTCVGYPANCNLPEGAARVQWTGETTNAFGWASLLDGSNVADLSDYVYPANLQYSVNSTIKTSNSVQSTNYSTNTWSQVQALYTDGTSITGSTRSVILDDPVQFAVASLVTKVKLANSVTTLTDKATSAITIPEGGYTLTGIMIGGQKNVDWEFAPISTSSVKTIYDKFVGTSIKTVYVDEDNPTAVAAWASNSTLVLPTAAAAEPTPINIALEFENSGTNAAAFEGFDGTINVGDKFYLIGTLTPAANVAVFRKDYTTTAIFRLSNDALSKAYHGLPDLRTSQLELGLSVDLTWQSGLTFTQDI